MDLIQLSGLSLCSFFIGLTVAIIILDVKKHNYEEDYGDTCTKSKHLFPPNLLKNEIFCFCGQEVLHLSTDKGFLIVKL